MDAKDSGEIELVILPYGACTYLCQFENMLLPVNNLQRSIVKPSSDVPRVGPTIFIDELSRLLWIFEVPPDYVKTFKADLCVQGVEGSNKVHAQAELSDKTVLE